MPEQIDLFIQSLKEKTVIDHARDNAALLSPEFVAWLPDNQHIWRAFAAEAIKVKAREYTHYSARTIIEHLRHHSALTEKTGEWKINNNNTTPLARLFDIVYPQHAGLFEYRLAASKKSESD